MMCFTILLKSSRARQIIKGREKNNWLCFALPVKTREKMRGFLPSSISFPACWQLYKSLWNNCVFLIKCEVVAISMLGFGADVLCAFEDVSVRLICAPVHRVGAITQARGDSYRQTGVNTGPWLEEKDLGDGSAVIECSVYCVITVCSVIFHAWLWRSALEWGWRPYRGSAVSTEAEKHERSGITGGSQTDPCLSLHLKLSQISSYISANVQRHGHLSGNSFQALYWWWTWVL